MYIHPNIILNFSIVLWVWHQEHGYLYVEFSIYA